MPLIGLIGWQLDQQADMALKARQDSTRQHVEITHGIVVRAHAQEASGKLGREQAQQLARESLATQLTRARRGLR